MMEREQMQTITVDGEAQAAWLSEVRRFHSKVELLALDAAGAVHTLMEINQKTSFWRLFHGPVSHVVLATSLGVTRWPCACVPTELLHIRVDERGQPEVWSGSMAVVKHFGAEAAPGDWLTGLVHVEAAHVRDLNALLASDPNMLRSLDLGGSEKLIDLQPIEGLAGPVLSR